MQHIDDVFETITNDAQKRGLTDQQVWDAWQDGVLAVTAKDLFIKKLTPQQIVDWLAYGAEGYAEDGNTEDQSKLLAIAEKIKQVFPPAIYGEYDN